VKWFRHFASAWSSLKLNRLIDELGVEGYGRYWLLLELLAEHFDGENTLFVLHYRQVSPRILLKTEKKIDHFFKKLSSFSLIEYNTERNIYKIECPIILELQDKDSKYNRKRVVKRSLGATLEEEEDIEKDLEEDLEKEIDSEKPNVAAPQQEIGIEILNYWNTKQIIKHVANAKSLKKTGQGIKHRSNYTIDEIKQAVDNYHVILTGPKYIWTHKWSLWEFLKRENADKFFPDEFDLARFPRREQNKQEALESKYKTMFSDEPPPTEPVYGDVELEKTEWGEV
jgi:hypothetical protein